MTFRDDWEKPHTPRWDAGEVGMGALRVALLFGSAAIALALILTPIVQNQAERMVSSHPGAGLDRIATGSIGQRDVNSYVVRRSVLQASPNAVCVIRNNGARAGDC